MSVARQLPLLPRRLLGVLAALAAVPAAHRQRLEELGVAAVLAKPFDPMALPGQISEALGWSAEGSAHAQAR